MVHRRMYVTGGIGSSGILERFTADYDLPNDYNYCESCASIGLAFFARRMMQITKKAKYVEVMERALYNTVLAGIAMDGKSFSMSIRWKYGHRAVWSEPPKSM